MRVPVTIAILVGAFLFIQTGRAQIGTIEIVSNTQEADIFVDSVHVGTAAERYFSVPSGTHLISLVRETEQWDPVHTSASVIVISGDTSIVSLELPRHYRIETFPIGADIVWEPESERPEKLGRAPVSLEHEGTPDGLITAMLPGYEPARIDAATLEEGGSVLITLAPQEGPNAHEAVILPTARSNHTRRFVDYGLVAGAVAAAALAVHFKFQANDLDDQYRDPESVKFGDADTLQRIERFDTYSTIALGASTAALGVLSIRFIIR